MKRVFSNHQVFWINLDKSIKRKYAMKRQLINVRNTRISAIDGTTLIDAKYNIVNANPLFTNPLCAVICSHIKAIKCAHDNNLNYAIILEDKCHFDFIEYFDGTIDDVIELANKKDKNWEVIQLSSIPLYDDLKDYQTNGLCVYKHDGLHFGSNYLINLTGMKKILDLIPTDGKSFFDLSKINKFLSPEDAIYKNLNTYLINLPIMYVYAEESTFKKYFINQTTDIKAKCHELQIETKTKLYQFYKKFTHKFSSFNYANNKINVKYPPNDRTCNASIYELIEKNDYKLDNFCNQENKVFIDIGANIGIATIIMALLNPKSLIYSFEPITDAYNLLIENIKLNNLTNVRAYNLAVTDKKTKKLTVSIHPEMNGASTSYSDPNIFSNHYNTTIETQDICCISFDEILINNKIQEVELLKIDCEEAEFDIIYDSELIKNRVIKNIVGKFHYLKYNIKSINKSEELIEYCRKYVDGMINVSILTID